MTLAVASISESTPSETRLFLLTGDPGAGKTTVVSKIILKLKTEGYTVGGVLTREIRARGERKGFTIIDISSEESAPLATAGSKLGPRIGKYGIHLDSLAHLGVEALKHAAFYSDVIVCDEVGPMELFSPEYRKAISAAVLHSTKPCLCVVHKRLGDPLIEEIKSNDRAKIFDVTFENREDIPGLVTEEILDLLRTKSDSKRRIAT